VAGNELMYGCLYFRIAGASPYQVQRNMGQSLSEKYDLMRQLRQKQHQQEELELKLF